jgi:hypothetical protein
MMAKLRRLLGDRLSRIAGRLLFPGGMRIRIRRRQSIWVVTVTGTVSGRRLGRAELERVAAQLPPEASGRTVLDLSRARLGQPSSFSDFIVSAYNSLPRGAHHQLAVVTDRGELEHHLKVWFGVEGTDAILVTCRDVDEAALILALADGGRGRERDAADNDAP